MISKSIPFLLLPILTKYLSTQEYGILSIYLLVLTLFTSLIGMSMHAIISKNFHKLTKRELSEYIGNIFYVLALTFFIYINIVFLTNFLYDELFSIPFGWYYIAPVISLMIIINQLNLTVLRNEERAKVYGIFEISNMMIKFLTTVLLVVYFHMNWQGQVYGILLSSLLFSVIGIRYLRKNGYVRGLFNKEIIISIIKTSIPMIPYSLSGIVILMSDRLFIERMVGIESVGIYSVGYSFGMIVMLFTDSFIKAWSPWFHKQLESASFETQIEIIKYSYLYFIGLFIITVLITFFANLIIPYLVGSEFLEAQEYVFWIALAFFFRGIYQIFYPYLFYVDKTYLLALSMFIAAVINIIFNYFLIEQFGTVGAAYATILAFATTSFLMWLYQQKYYPMPWRLKRNRNDVK